MVQTSYCKEVLALLSWSCKEDLAVSRTQAQATHNQSQEELLADAKRSSCGCINFGLYCNPSPFKVFNIPAGWRPWLWRSSIRVPVWLEYFGMITTTRRSNNGGHTRLRGDWNPSGKCHDLLHEGVTLIKWDPVKLLLTRVLASLKQQVCTETLTFLAARMH